MQLSIHEPTIAAIALKSKSWLPTLRIMGYILGMCMRMCVFVCVCVCVRECLWVFFKSCSTKLTINLIFLRAVSDNLSKILAVFCSDSRVLRSTSVFNWTPGREPGVANHDDDAAVTRPPVTSWAVTQWVWQWVIVDWFQGKGEPFAFQCFSYLRALPHSSIKLNVALGYSMQIFGMHF